MIGPGPGPGPGVRVRARIAARGLDVDLDVPAGRVLALVGANGSGKSSTLSVVAGLLRPDAGRVDLDGRVLLDTAARVDVPAHRRGVALLRQQALLFPHLSVRDNVAFAPRAAGRTRREAAERAREWLAAVDATDLADRRPAALSGGQAQRVALARALAAQPRLLLLDEPFTALDVASAPELRRLLRRTLVDAGRTAIVVTHDLLDCLALADELCVLDAGRVAERGPVRDVLAAPRTEVAARLAGVNLLVGRSAGGGRVVLAGGPEVVGVGAGVAVGEPVVAVFAPAAVALYPQAPGGSPRNAWRAQVVDASDVGGSVRVRLALLGEAGPGPHVVAADVTPAAAADLRLEPGARLVAVVKATEIAVHPAGREGSAG